MPNKNRKLILRDNEIVKAFSPEFIEALRIEAERAMRGVPDNVWFRHADKRKRISDLFKWEATPQRYEFWAPVACLFAVEPLPEDAEAKRAFRLEVLEREKSELESRSRELEAEIARLRGEDA